MKHWPPKYDIVSSKEKQIEKRQKSSQRSLTHVCPFFTFLKIDRTDLSMWWSRNTIVILKTQKYLSSKTRPRSTKISNIPLHPIFEPTFLLLLHCCEISISFPVHRKSKEREISRHRHRGTASKSYALRSYVSDFPRIDAHTDTSIQIQIQIRTKRADNTTLDSITCLIRSRERSKSDRRIRFPTAVEGCTRG